MEKIDKKVLLEASLKYGEQQAQGVTGPIRREKIITSASYDFRSGAHFGYKRRNDEVIVEIQSRIDSINTNLNEIIDPILCGKLEWQRNELTNLITKLK